MGLIVMAIFTATVTSALTAASLDLEPSNLEGYKVTSKTTLLSMGKSVTKKLYRLNLGITQIFNIVISNQLHRHHHRHQGLAQSVSKCAAFCAEAPS